VLLKHGKILTRPLTKAFSANTAGSGTWPSAMAMAAPYKDGRHFDSRVVLERGCVAHFHLHCCHT